MSGKGDNPRPLSVTLEQFAERFDAIDWNARERDAAQRKLEADVARIHHEHGAHATAIGIQCGVLGVMGIDFEEVP